MMGKIKRGIIWSLFLLVGIITFILFTGSEAVYRPDGTITEQLVNQTKETLNQTINNARFTYVDYLSEHQTNVDAGLSTLPADLKNSEALLNTELGLYAMDMPKDTIALYEVHVPEAGFYHIGLNYKVSNATLNQITIAVRINGETYYQEMQTIEIPIIWQDESKEYLTD